MNLFKSMNPVKPEVVTLSNGKQVLSFSSKAEYDRWVLWNRIFIAGFAAVGAFAGTAISRRKR